MRREWVTDVVIAANVLVFVAMVLSGIDAISPDARSLISWGANFGPYSRGNEPWRLLTSTFVHGGLLHLGFNMYALLMAGRLVERIFGHLGYALIYTFAGLAGSAASALANPLVASVGASGSVFGVFGALLAFLVRRRSLLAPEVLRPLRRSVVTVVLLNVGLGFTMPGIDNAAHLGGLGAGFLAGLLVAPSLEGERLRRPWGLYPVPLVVGAGIVAWVMSAPVI
jgi:rhomboid protease GluP